jgi:hypothetical protein
MCIQCLGHFSPLPPATSLTPTKLVLFVLSVYHSSVELTFLNINHYL